MRKKNTAPDEGPHGVDRWSCNGYGLMLDGKPVPPPDHEAENEDIGMGGETAEPDDEPPTA